MPASVAKLGDLHSQLAETLLELTRPREVVILVKGEPLLDAAGNPRTMTVFPTAAEVGAATAFLKNNNITATDEGNEALAKLREKLAESRKRAPPVLPDPEADAPAVH